MLFFQAGDSVFGAKDDVVVNLYIGTHGRFGYIFCQRVLLKDILAVVSYDDVCV